MPTIDITPVVGMTCAVRLLKPGTKDPGDITLGIVAEVKQSRRDLTYRVSRVHLPKTGETLKFEDVYSLQYITHIPYTLALSVEPITGGWQSYEDARDALWPMLAWFDIPEFREIREGLCP